MGSQRLGSKGIEVRGVSFSWPDGSAVLAGVSVVFEPGDRIGIVGPNGAGKSTLLNLVAGRLTPSAGEIECGATVKIGYFDQLSSGLDPTQRVREAVAGNKGEPSLAAPIGTLSGGERRRLQLLLTLVEQPNVLLFDEPTNDLDLDTLRALEDFLDDWPGIVVTVSHDRSFLDRVTEELLALDGQGGARWIRGGVAVWLAEHQAQSTVPQQTGRSTPVAPAVVASKPAGTKSASTLRRMLEKAEKDLASATTKLAAVTVELQNALDHREMAAIGERLAAAQVAVDQAEERWLGLAL
jgi:ATP-binding cassette subfamily F protein uup